MYIYTYTYTHTHTESKALAISRSKDSELLGSGCKGLGSQNQDFGLTAFGFKGLWPGAEGLTSALRV